MMRNHSGDWCVVGGYTGGTGQSRRMPLLLRVGGTWGGGSTGLQVSWALLQGTHAL